MTTDVIDKSLEISNDFVHIKDTTANPAPLGLMGFGMTTILLNLHNIGFFELSSIILAMGLFYGGVAQIIAGVMEWKKDNTFGTTAFTSFGLFWISLVAIIVGPTIGFGKAPDSNAMGSYLLMWGIFTLGMFIISLKLDSALQFVFGSLAILFIMLAIADFTGIALIKTIAGYVGIICGASAIITALRQVLNDVHEQSIS